MTTGGRRPRTGLGWERVRRHRSSKAARPDNGPESPHRRRTFAVAVAASSSSAGRPACPDRCRQPVGVRGVNGGELFPGGIARDVFDLDCAQAGGAAVLVYPRSSHRIRPARAGTSRPLDRRRRHAQSPRSPLLRYRPWNRASHTLRGLTNPRGPRPSDSSIILLLTPVMTVDAYAAQAADTAVAVVRGFRSGGHRPQ